MFRFAFYGLFRLGTIVLSLVLIWFVGLLFFIRSVPVEPAHIPDDAQAVVVFTGTPQRIQKGLELQEKLKIPLLISGVKEGVSLSHLTQKNIPDGQVTLGRQALDTIGNAEETAEWLEKNGISSIILVTSNYHVPRSLLELRRLKKDIKITVIPTVNSGFFKMLWWKDHDARGLVIEEYNKYVFALVRNFSQRFLTQNQ